MSRKKVTNEKEQVKLPAAPHWLNKQGKEIWDRLLPELWNKDLMFDTKLELFAAACQSYGTWLECEQYFETKDPRTGEPYGKTYVYVNKKGEANEVPRPQVRIGQQSLARFQGLAERLGLFKVTAWTEQTYKNPQDEIMERILAKKQEEKRRRQLEARK